MDFTYGYMNSVEEGIGAIFGIIYLLYYLIVIGLGITAYVLSSLGLYTIAKRRGIHKPWLAWIPVANFWIVGSISDQYRYVTKGQIKNKRKTLLILECITVVLCIALFAVMMVNAVGMVDASIYGTEEEITAYALRMVLWCLVCVLPMFGVCIATTVIYYMAMYDLYTSVNPPYNVTFLVLSIFFNVTEPFFIFFNRKKDKGMPPRCDIHTAPAAQPVLPPQPAIEEPWENVTEE